MPIIVFVIQDDVGLVAFNDAQMLYSGIYTLIDIYLKDHPCHLEIVELFLKTNEQTVFGQVLDIFSSKHVDTFTELRHRATCNFKTSYYSTVLPARLGLYLSGNSDKATHWKVEEIMLKGGEYLQMIDDFIDCYADPKVMGKLGTDMEEGKCNYPIVWAMQKASEAQKAVIRDNFGKPGKESVKLVKDIYEQLNMKQLYRDNEKELLDSMDVLVAKVTSESNLSAGIFNDVVIKLQTTNKTRLDSSFNGPY